MKALVLFCPSGISGDMALASLVDLGFPLERLTAALAGAGLEGVSVSASRGMNGALDATTVEVVATEAQPPRAYPQVLELVSRLEISESAMARVRETLARLAGVEARLHGCDIVDVRLHEMGAWDTIVDVAGFAMALEYFEVEAVYVSAIETGTGLIDTEHGVLPVPAPATLVHLAGFEVTSSVLGFELTTPTGAALMAATAAPLAEIGPYRLIGTGLGSGSLVLEDRPNIVYATLAETVGSAPSEAGDYSLLETNLDDRSGEISAGVVTRLLARGALDVWTAQVIGKKGRPAVVLSAICPPASVELLAEAIMRETGSLGVRVSAFSRRASERRLLEVNYEGLTFRVKAGPYASKVEYEDLLDAADRLDRPLLELSREVALVFHREHPDLPLPQ